MDLKQQLKRSAFGPKDDTPLKEEPIFYKVGDYYEITINPCNEFQRTGELSRFASVHNNFKQILKQLFKKKYILYYFVPEISEPKFSNKSGSYPRIHYHGIIQFKSPTAVVGFLLRVFNKLKDISSFQINPLRPEHWNQYIHKQKDIIQPVLDQVGLNYILTNMSEKARTRAFERKAACSPERDAEAQCAPDKRTQ